MHIDNIVYTIYLNYFHSTNHACMKLGMSFLFSPAPPPAPTITDVSFTAGVSFTVEWSETPGSCETVDNFTFNITPNDLSCTRSTMTTVTCSYNRTHLGQMYTFTVAGLNCGTQSGDEATITISLQGMSLTKIVKHGHNVPVYIGMFGTQIKFVSLILVRFYE